MRVDEARCERSRRIRRNANRSGVLAEGASPGCFVDGTGGQGGRGGHERECSRYIYVQTQPRRLHWRGVM